MNTRNGNWKWNAFAIAAAVAATVAPASAQEVTLKATIPFAFSISKDASFAPGKYVVIHDNNVWRFRNVDSKESAQILASGHQGSTAEQPSLTFDCLGTHCQLRAIHAGGNAVGAEVAAPQLSNQERAEIGLVSVALKPVEKK
jgi:hypothetical protein